jgi:hypothetical protein
MKKIILTEADKKNIVSVKEKAIIESFAKTFNSIKRLDENEIGGNLIIYRKGSKLFHGTKHEIDNFSTEKIGTGEGAQSFGYGLYFTESKNIGYYYAFTLSDAVTILVDGKEIDNPNLKKIVSIILKQSKDFKALEDKNVFITRLNSIIRNFKDIGEIPSQLEELKQFIANSNSIEVIPPKEAYIYEVEVTKDLKLINYDDIIPEKLLRDLNNELGVNLKSDVFENIFEMLIKKNGVSDKYLTKVFMNSGYDGIIFKAGRMSFEKVGDNTNNVVIFSDDSIKIIDKVPIFY